jgi:hypothetical protein
VARPRSNPRVKPAFFLVLHHVSEVPILLKTPRHISGKDGGEAALGAFLGHALPFGL